MESDPEGSSHRETIETRSNTHSGNRRGGRACHLSTNKQWKSHSALNTTNMEKSLKEQIGGSHYNQMKIEPVEFIQANGIGFCEGNIIKYVSRYRFKNGVEDLKKARHYLEMLIESMEDSETVDFSEVPVPVSIEHQSDEIIFKVSSTDEFFAIVANLLSRGYRWTAGGNEKGFGPSREHVEEIQGDRIHLHQSTGFISWSSTQRDAEDKK